MTANTPDVDLVRSEEQLDVGVVEHEAGRIRTRKHVETHHVEELVDRGIEHAEVKRSGVIEGDSGQVETLPDGSVSIPVFEEQLVIEKRLVVRERIIVRKRTVVEHQRVEADLQREHIEVEADGAVESRVADTTG